MKAQTFRKKKNSLRVRLDVHQPAGPSAIVSAPRLRRIVRATLQAAGRGGSFALSLAFVSGATMRRLNRDFAGNDYVSDVLSFATQEDTGAFARPPSRVTYLGEVVICLPQARQQARAAQQSLERELDWLLAHGTLHLLGFDHATARENRDMRALETKVLQA